MGDDCNKTLEHLKLIQAIIERMGRNSFLLKGWAVTLITALYLFAREGVTTHYILLGIFPALAFWYLDAYFLSQARLYRWFYDRVRQRKHVDQGDFDLTPHRSPDADIESPWQVMMSDTLKVFYPTIIGVTLLVWGIANLAWLWNGIRSLSTC